MTLALHTLKSAGQDFEWYPTTPEILDRVGANILKRQRRYHSFDSILDIGAGDGRALLHLAQKANLGTLYAIEKSRLLVERMDRQILILGTDFLEQTLFDKSADITFCNPPYSQYEDWAARCIRESTSHLLYLVIPDRWQESELIADALAMRGCKADAISIPWEFTFERAERAARARVQILCIELPNGRADDGEDAFGCWVAREFAALAAKQEEAHQRRKATVSQRQAIVASGGDLVTALEEAYQAEMAHLQENYHGISALDAELLDELHIDVPAIARILRKRIDELKAAYWKLLFSNLDKLTRALTTKNRDAMLRTLTRHTHIDFTAGNIAAVVLWCIKHANAYITDQLLDTFDSMVSHANITAYKSNARVFQEGWRFRQEYERGEITQIKLDYRLVIDRKGGINTSEFSFNATNGMENRAMEFLRDLITVAHNLGYTVAGTPMDHQWSSGHVVTFHTTGTSPELVFEARAFKKGTIHLRLGKSFALALNAETARLRGWCLDAAEAASEMDAPLALVQRAWGSLISADPGLYLPG